MSTATKQSFFIATLVFIACFCAGLWVARHRPLWNDEYYSEVSSIHNTSYAQQLAGQVGEGGNAPLFYVLQKFFLQAIHYQVPAGWLQGHWSNDKASQIILRINPIFFMSLSVALVFYYFCRNYSLWIGLYSLFITISSYMFWAYWAEARPYALIVFLTTAQSVILLNKIRDPQADKGWVALAVTNILLGLTTILSLGQIAAVSVLWWVLSERDWRKYVFITLLPAAIIMFYYMRAPKYPFYFGDLTPEQLIRDNIPRQYFDILFFFLVSLFFFRAQQQTSAMYFIFTILVLAATGVLLGLFALHAKPGVGFPITSRYFIYLMPIGVMAATASSVSLVQALQRHRPIQYVVIGVVGLLLIQHFQKIAPKAIHSLIGNVSCV
jgi:hypothetical protein